MEVLHYTKKELNLVNNNVIFVDSINTDTFLSKVLEIEVDGKMEKVIPREVAYHVVSEEPIHIDFMRIVSGKKIVLEIPVKHVFVAFGFQKSH